MARQVLWPPDAELSRNLRQRTIASMPGEVNYRELAHLHHPMRVPSSQITVFSHSTAHHVSGETARAQRAS